MIIWKSDLTVSVIYSRVPQGYFIVKLCGIMAAQKAFVTFVKDSDCSGKPILSLNNWNTL